MSSAALLAITVVLLIAGVVGSVVPAIPGAALSLGGILFHWWATGYTTPGTPALLTFAGLAVAAILVDLFGGAIAASSGGASKGTVAVAIGVSLVLAFGTGPLGVLIGLPVTVFLVEFLRHRDRGAAGHAAFVTTVGIFASTFVQVLLTTTILVGFLLVILL